MNKKYLFGILATVVIIVVVLLTNTSMFSSKVQTTGIDANPGIKRCPEKMVVNEIPGADRSGESDSNDAPVRSSYYVLENKQYKVEEFNTAWVAANCYVPTESAN